MISALWHGVFPSYLIAFNYINLFLTLEKKIYLCKKSYYWNLIFGIYYNISIIFFKAVSFKEIYQLFKNTSDI